MRVKVYTSGGGPKPANISFEDAAAVPVAPITVLQGVRDKGRIQKDQRVLVDGASDGVGTFAVQIAKSLGADVTALCSTRNVGTPRSNGADHVIDYTRTISRVAYLQIDLIDPEFHAITQAQFTAIRDKTKKLLDDAVAAGRTQALQHRRFGPAVPDAGTYAPVTILIDERADGVHISFDRMASYLAPYGNAEALKVARDLDAKVEALLTAAAR
jgi:NADPH:quinone reductase-like Zn-dependent oxidoreductase